MGSYTDLTVGGYPILETKSYASLEALTIFRESDKIIRALTFDEAAYITAERMARASAINTDEIELRDSQMELRC